MFTIMCVAYGMVPIPTMFSDQGLFRCLKSFKLPYLKKYVDVDVEVFAIALLLMLFSKMLVTDVWK